MTALWSWRELSALFSCELAGDAVTGVSIDTRTLQPGDMFVALQGEADGHDYLKQATAAGASCVMVHRDCSADIPTIRVDDTLKGLWQLGKAARARTKARIIAITGSSGKTTLRFWLQGILSGVGKTHASVASYNNHWGVPLSLARMPADSEYGVFEIGTNHPGEIGPLAELVSPDVAVVLNVAPAHIGNFRDMEELIAEKLSIMEGLQPEGRAVVHHDFAGRCSGRIISFGTDPRADVHGEGMFENGVFSITAEVCGRRIELDIPLAGEHRLYSVLATLGVLQSLDVDPGQLKGAYASLSVPAGRGLAEVLSGITLIDDSYNANEVSMSLAITALNGARTNGRKIALLGEMLELGENARAAHEGVADACHGLDVVYTFGEGFRNITPAAKRHRHFDRVEDFDLTAFRAELNEGDTVLVKGANKVFWVPGFTERLKEVLLLPG